VTVVASPARLGRGTYPGYALGSVGTVAIGPVAERLLSGVLDLVHRPGAA
jgi:hypothetical protein